MRGQEVSVIATAAEVVKKILGKILVRASESPIEADEGQDTISAMNDYMTMLDAKGISLGYTIVSDLSDEITIPAGAIQGLVSNVAMELASDFGATITPALAQSAKNGLDAMRKLGITIEPLVHPRTLPLGSGNEISHNTERFYPGRDDNIITETGRNIGLETNT